MSKKVGIVAIVISVVSLLCALFSVGYCIKTVGFGNGNSGSKATVEDEYFGSMEKRTQYVLYVGTNDQDTYKIEMTEAEAKDLVDQICLKYMKGYTLDEATGSWVDDDGIRTHEYTLVCYFDDPEIEDVYSCAEEIREALNQSSILIEANEINMEYYSAE